MRHKILWLAVLTMHQKEGFTLTISLHNQGNLSKKASSAANTKDFIFFVVSLVSVISFFLKIDDFIRNGITLNSSLKIKAVFAKEFLFFYYSQIRSHLLVLRVKKTYLKCSLNLSRRRKWPAKISFFN